MRLALRSDESRAALGSGLHSLRLTNNFDFLGSNRDTLRAAGCVLLCLFPLLLAWDSLPSLGTLVVENETFSHVPLIPLVTLFILYLNRKNLFTHVTWGWALGAVLMIPGTIFLGAARFAPRYFLSSDRAVLFLLGMVLFWMGSFALFFGGRTFGDARFPLFFLLFMVPIPQPMLSKVIYFLQKESAEAAELFFRLAGIPYLRQDFVFALPGVTIRVAEECSGIRSTLALLITTVLISHFLLKSNWKRALVCLAIVPISILKNGLRIMTLSTLAVYVNPDFLYGNLHHHGGIVFFVIGLVPLILMLLWLQRSERRIPA